MDPAGPVIGADMPICTFEQDAADVAAGRAVADATIASPAAATAIATAPTFLDINLALLVDVPRYRRLRCSTVCRSLRIGRLYRLIPATALRRAPCEVQHAKRRRPATGAGRRCRDDGAFRRRLGLPFVRPAPPPLRR